MKLFNAFFRNPSLSSNSCFGLKEKVIGTMKLLFFGTSMDTSCAISVMSTSFTFM
jgi:hypothetical protein